MIPAYSNLLPPVIEPKPLPLPFTLHFLNQTAPKLIAALHDSAIGGHSGIQATYQRVNKVFYWKGLKADVIQFVHQCVTCQKAKCERTHPAGLLQPLPVPQGVWEDVTMDFIEGLPKSEGFDTIWWWLTDFRNIVIS